MSPTPSLIRGNKTLEKSGTVAQAAEALECSEKTIRRWIAEGLLDAKRVGPRLIRIPLTSIESFGRTLGGDTEWRTR